MMATEKSERIISIDVFRGFTMFLLIGESTYLFNGLLGHSTEGSFFYLLAEQFHHHPWNGLRFWDLIQPYFMFIVGLSMPFSLESRLRHGQSNFQITTHVIKRSIILIFLGWALYCINNWEIRFRFQNVLTQIGFTYLAAYLIMKRTFGWQVVFSIGLLVITDVIYRLFPVPGFDQPFEIMKNFGTWLDMQYGGADTNGGWVSFNAVPTTAHTIWGVLTARVLINKDSKAVFNKLFVVGLAMVVLGFILNPVTPIIKRTATSSFVIVSGGYCLLTFAIFYWIVDIIKWKSIWMLFFSIVGMNSLFIYLFSNLGGTRLIRAAFYPFNYFMDQPLANALTSILVWMSLWGICYLMYLKRLFVRI